MASNRLASAASAYLRSAAHQPVHWHPWGPEPFAEAERTDRPVLLDVGAVWCHWCHVMDGESYDDPALAGFLNEHFVCVKVDRDERPDVDARYQRAVQAVARQGGWPLTGFLTPGGELFYGGTYFPPEAAHGRSSFRQVLERILEVWRGERGQVLAQARTIRETLAAQLDQARPGEVSDTTLADATGRILSHADRGHGGFGSRPKFPHATTALFLLARAVDTGDETIRAVLVETLDGMARGGFHDLLGGGFHRYSTDERWIVPHFEKMASDNAELLDLYAGAAAALDKPRWAAVARETVRWIREVLADPDGGYGASQDADIGPGDDGDYFTWTEDEIAEAIEPSARGVAFAHFGIGTFGRMPHAPDRNVLFAAADPPALAERFGRTPTDIEAVLSGVAARLRAARGARRPPIVDRTRYTGWNAMVAGALLRAAPMICDRWAAEHALRTLTRIRRESPEPDAVGHLPGGAPGLLEDPVHCADAALEAFEATGDPAWLAWAEGLMERTWRQHWDAAGGLRDTELGRSGEGLLPDPVRPIQDSPNASPNGVAGLVLARLREHTRKPRWGERHRDLIGAFGGLGAEIGLFASAYLRAADWGVHPATHLVVTGPPEDQHAARLHQAARAVYLPRRVVVRLTPGMDPAILPPAAAALAAGASRTRAIACTGDRCLAPVDDPAAWEATLRGLVSRLRAG